MLLGRIRPHFLQSSKSCYSLKPRSTHSVEVSHRQQHRSYWICFSTRSSPDTTTISDTQPQVYMSYATSYHTVCGFENHHGDLFIASFVGLRSSPRSKSKPSTTTRWTHLASFYRCGYRNTNTYVASLCNICYEHNPSAHEDGVNLGHASHQTKHLD